MDVSFYEFQIRGALFPRVVIFSPEICDRIADLARKGYGPMTVATLLADEFEDDEYGDKPNERYYSREEI